MKTLLALLAAAERTPRLGAVNAERVRGLITRYAATVPGALASGEEPDHGRIETAVRSELEWVEPADADERQAAAKKIAQFSDFHRLWGRPAVIDGSVGRGTAS